MIELDFASKSFDIVWDGLRAKYPDLRCSSSTVANSLGARLPQEECGRRQLFLPVTNIRTAGCGGDDYR